jgi:hypothetical protein
VCDTPTRGARAHGTFASAVRAIALAGLVTLGCATDRSGLEAGSVSDGGDAGDGSDATAATACAGSRRCVGSELHACRGGQVAETIQICTDSCSLGRCLSSGCAVAEADRTSFIGCLFYAFEPSNVATDLELSTSLLVTNPGMAVTAAFVERAVRDGDGGTTWASIASATVGAYDTVRFAIDPHPLTDPGVSPVAAIRVRSVQPVSVAVIHSDDSDPSRTYSSGGTMVWPLQSLGSQYAAMTYPQSGLGGVEELVGGRGGAGRVAIVATQPGTLVRLAPTAVVDSAGQLLDSVELGDGDVLQVYSADPTADLSGTEVVSNLPVAVFSGNVTTSYGREADGVHSPDMAHEELPPLGAWSRGYVAASLQPQSGVCETLLGTAGGSLWRILAGTDKTQIVFDPADRPDLPTSPLWLDRGAVAEFVASGSFALTASSPVLVTQGMDCEPSLSLGVSTDRLLKDWVFAVLPGFDQMVTVARTAGAFVLLDGAPLARGMFSPAGALFEVAQITLPDCPLSASVCTHRLSSDERSFGATVRGMDALSSYALTAPTFRGCIDPRSDPDCAR